MAIKGSGAEHEGRKKLSLDLARRNWALLIAALLVGGVAGAGIGVASQQSAIANGQADYEEQVTNNEFLSDKVHSLDEKVSEMVSEANTKALEAADRDADLTARETAVSGREEAVAGAEQQQAKQEFADGVQIVGTTIDPGVYSTPGPNGKNPVGCYYVWKSGTGSDASIVDNNITKGPATVTLVAGEVFESKSCQTWNKIG